MNFFGFEGAARLWTVFEYVDASYATKLLPDYVRLASSSEFPRGMHPMMYSFGTQTVALRPFTWLKTSYRESIIGVCSVELKNASSQGRYSLMTATPVSNLLAMLLGRLFGFPKTMKRLSAADREFTIATLLSNRLMVSNVFQPDGPPFASTNDSRLRTVASFLAHPIISRAPWGPLLSSRFQINKDGWKVTPVTALGRIKAEDLAGLPGGRYPWPPVDGVALGTFLTEHRWQANLPAIVWRR